MAETKHPAEAADTAEAPVDAESSVAKVQESAPQRRRRWILFLGLAGLIVILDQISKIWVDSSFDLALRSIPAGQAGAPTELIGEFVRIAKTYNDGAIFGLFDTSALLMALLTVLVVGGILFYEWRYGGGVGPLVTVGLGLLLGGAVGNLIDRMAYGHVIDFVDMGIGSTRWYAWNISDAAVTIGIIVLFVAALLGDRAIPGRRQANEDS